MGSDDCVSLFMFKLVLMSSEWINHHCRYNRVNGLHVSENPRLLVDILRGVSVVFLLLTCAHR